MIWTLPNLLTIARVLAVPVIVALMYIPSEFARWIVALLFASGIPVTLRSNRELNNDGIGSDRPVGVTRNSYRLPSRQNVDFRYSRLFPVAGTTKFELLFEVKNLFNSEQWAGATSVVATDTAGNPVTGTGAPLQLPTPGVVERGAIFGPTGGYEQRQLQIGFRVTFLLMLALVITNFGNIMAEFAGVASSLELFGLSRYVVVPLAAAAVWFLVVHGTYRSIEKIFLVASLFYVCYIVAGFLAHPDWRAATASMVTR